MNYFKNFDFTPVFWFFGIVGGVVVLLISFVVWLVLPESKCKRIESNKLIPPKVEYIGSGTKIDTIYIYEIQQ